MTKNTNSKQRYDIEVQITTGRCIYEYDMNIRFEYESKIRGMWLDFKPFLMDLRARTIEQIIKGSSH